MPPTRIRSSYVLGVFARIEVSRPRYCSAQQPPEHLFFWDLWLWLEITLCSMLAVVTELKYTRICGVGRAW